MSAAKVVMEARAAGVHLGVDGDEIVLEASVQPPAAVLDALFRHKTEVVALLRLAEDWLAFYDERAVVAEFDGGLPRAAAEARAFACCVVEWLNRNFARSPPGRCLACGGGDHSHGALLPHGIEPTDHAWLHSCCWPAWHAERKGEAVATLAAMGIAPPPGFADDFGKIGGA